MLALKKTFNNGFTSQLNQVCAEYFRVPTGLVWGQVWTLSRLTRSLSSQAMCVSVCTNHSLLNISSFFFHQRAEKTRSIKTMPRNFVRMVLRSRFLSNGIMIRTTGSNLILSTRQLFGR